MIDTRVLDRTDEALLRAAWQVERDCAVGLALDPSPAWESARRAWPAPHPEREVVFLGAYLGEEMAGAAWLGLPQQDNLHLAHFELHVAPSAQRRGIGSALLAEVEAHAVRRGRTTYLTDTVVPLGGAGAGVGFGQAHGYVPASSEECKVADLAEGEHRLAELAALAAERSARYRLVAWEDPLPPEWMDDMCGLYGSFLGEIPLEGMDLQGSAYTAERVRANEQVRVAAGRRDLTVAAVGPDGHLAGWSDVSVHDARPERADVHSTMVVPAHRGHRLGLALKVGLHRELRARFPAVREVVTYNAGVNEHMNAVNARLGYRVVQHLVDLQKKV